jgi:hypothetical protein
MTLATAASATTYTWTDENGQVHYSDRPHPGATEVDLRPAQGYAAPAPRTEPAAAATSSPPPAATSSYRRVEIMSPAVQETLWNIEGSLPVQVELEPSLQAGHHFDVYLDGQLVDLNATSPQFTVPEVWRGVHSLQVAVNDLQEREIVRSLAVVFQVQQTSLLNPQNPNSPANAPRPAR